MKKSNRIVLILFFLSLGCSPLGRYAFDRQYDSSPIYIDPARRDLDQIALNVHRIQTSLKFKLGEITPTVSVIGLATSLDAYHLLTAKHVVRIESVQVATPFGPVEFQIPDEDRLEENTFIVLDDGSRIKTNIVYADKERDFVLLKAEKELRHSPLTIGNSDELRVGQFLFLFGNLQSGRNIRTGYVTQTNFVKYGEKGEVSHTDDAVFGISAVTVQGDSGAPLFLLRDGRFELSGMVVFLMPEARGLGFGIKINPIMTRIKKYLQ